MPPKREKQKEWYEAFTCSQCRLWKPMKGYRDFGGRPILGNCPNREYGVGSWYKACRKFE